MSSFLYSEKDILRFLKDNLSFDKDEIKEKFLEVKHDEVQAEICYESFVDKTLAAVKSFGLQTFDSSIDVLDLLCSLAQEHYKNTAYSSILSVIASPYKGLDPIKFSYIVL